MKNRTGISFCTHFFFPTTPTLSPTCHCILRNIKNSSNTRQGAYQHPAAALPCFLWGQGSLIFFLFIYSFTFFFFFLGGGPLIYNMMCVMVFSVYLTDYLTVYDVFNVHYWCLTASAIIELVRLLECTMYKYRFRFQVFKQSDLMKMIFMHERHV